MNLLEKAFKAQMREIHLVTSDELDENLSENNLKAIVSC